jgi:cytochrome c553
MERLSLQLALGPAIVATVLATAVTRAFASPQERLQAKLEYCKTCHGISGEGYRGSLPIPRLAGQQAKYLENQLRAFIERRRESKFMFAVANALSPTMLPALAAHFKDLNAKPLKGAPKDLVAVEKKLYEEGPETSIQPCVMCHGPDAKGEGTAPRLAGQLWLCRKNIAELDQRAMPRSGEGGPVTYYGIDRQQLDAAANRRPRGLPQSSRMIY